MEALLGNISAMKGDSTTYWAVGFALPPFKTKVRLFSIFRFVMFWLVLLGFREFCMVFSFTDPPLITGDFMLY